MCTTEMYYYFYNYYNYNYYTTDLAAMKKTKLSHGLLACA